MTPSEYQGLARKIIEFGTEQEPVSLAEQETRSYKFSLSETEFLLLREYKKDDETFIFHHCGSKVSCFMLVPIMNEVLISENDTKLAKTIVETVEFMTLSKL